ncbi:MAG: glycosyltransferase [Lachnospiraceae bacterium]|nr:glycosyltransferase [Lachnospiraceae bacterium]
MKTYVLIEGIYDTVDLFSEEIREYLTSRRDRCIVLHQNTMDKDLKKLLGPHIDAVIAFNNLGYSLGNNEGGNLWDLLGTRYINILMDHPFHYHNQLLSMPKCAEVYCVDQNHVDYIRKYYPHIRHTGFIPHAGCMHAIRRLSTKNSEKNGVSVDNKSTFNRDIDILYAGNLSRIMIEQLIPDFDLYPELDGILFSKEVLNRLIDDPSLTTEQAIIEHLSDLHIPIESPEDELRYINGFRFIDGFATSYYRELSVRILAENGFKVSILGLGWEQCGWIDTPNVTLLGKVNAAEVLPYMKRSKIVLNTLTWFKRGMHDRIINGLMSGAYILSDTSEYLKEITDGILPLLPMTLFDPLNIEELPYTAELILSDYERLHDRIEYGIKWANENHSWANRLETVL